MSPTHSIQELNHEQVKHVPLLNHAGTHWPDFLKLLLSIISSHMCVLACTHVYVCACLPPRQRLLLTTQVMQDKAIKQVLDTTFQSNSL